MRSSTMKKALLMAAVTVTLWTNYTSAEEEQPSASADLGIFSKYVWRGYELSDDNIVIQPSATVGYKGFGFNLWGNIDSDLDDTNASTPNSSAWNETDFTASYGRNLGGADLELGYIYYGLDGLDDTQEIYASVSYRVLLAPTLTVYRDIGTLPGWYLNFGLYHSVDLPRGMTLDVSGSMAYYISDDDAFVEVDSNQNPTNSKYRKLHDGLISAELTLPLDKHMTLTPMAAYSFPLSDDADNLL